MKSIGLLFLCFILLACQAPRAQKINGLSFVASRDKVESKHITAVVKMNANYVAVMPFGFVRTISSSEVLFNNNQQWFGETKAGAKQYITMLQEKGVSVMLKPQIWVGRGAFTGTIKMTSEKDWQSFEKDYSSFIITYAELAEEMKLPLLCIGTELEQFVKNRPQYWQKLIKEVRAIYKGKLTYAANWDEYKRTPFWGDLDYIGIDAYFPLSNEKEPSLDSLKKGWIKHKTLIHEKSKQANKPVLFTEFGYRSCHFTAKKPWLVDRNNTPVNLKAQSIATQAILEEFWGESWFAGGFVWKWFIDFENVGGINDNRFTPQNKPAEMVLRSFYGKTVQ